MPRYKLTFVNTVYIYVCVYVTHDILFAILVHANKQRQQTNQLRTTSAWHNTSPRDCCKCDRREHCVVCVGTNRFVARKVSITG